MHKHPFASVPFTTVCKRLSNARIPDVGTIGCGAGSRRDSSGAACGNLATEGGCGEGGGGEGGGGDGGGDGGGGDGRGGGGEGRGGLGGDGGGLHLTPQSLQSLEKLQTLS